MTQSAAPNERRQSVPVFVGKVQVGGGAPIVVQSMTNTDTADAEVPRARSRRSRVRAAKSCASRSTATRRRLPCRASRKSF